MQDWRGQRRAWRDDKGGIAAERIARKCDDLLDWHKQVRGLEQFWP
jgi:hypothetical protein